MFTVPLQDGNSAAPQTAPGHPHAQGARDGLSHLVSLHARMLD